MPKEKPLLRQLVRASTVGIHIVITTFVGFGMGYFVDRWLGTKPWFSLGMMLIGIFAGFRDLARMARLQLDEDQDGTDKKG